MSRSLLELDDRWGWATEDTDPERVPETLRRLELASNLAEIRNDPMTLQIEIMRLSREGAIRG